MNEERVKVHEDVEIEDFGAREEICNVELLLERDGYIRPPYVSKSYAGQSSVHVQVEEVQEQPKYGSLHDSGGADYERDSETLP